MSSRREPGTRAARDPIAPFLARQGFVVLDGGLATLLEARGHDLNDALWSARVLLEAPESVRAVHRDYLAAGADCIATCTYQATYEGFRVRGLSDAEAEELFRRAVRLAIEARDAFWRERGGDGERLPPLVAASVGPYGAYLADGSEYVGDDGLSEGELIDFHARRWRTLLSAGPDLVACETIPSLREARALAALLAETGAAGWISFSCRDAVHISDGTPLADAVGAIQGTRGLLAVGINCIPPLHAAALVAEVRRATNKPVFVYPNAGGRYDPERKIWEPPASDFDWTRAAQAWVAAGARGVGGCCRVGPGDIRDLRASLTAQAPAS